MDKMVPCQLRSKSSTWSAISVAATYRLAHRTRVDWVEARTTAAEAIGEGIGQNESQRCPVMRNKL
jgi:hypothetical protein